MPCYDSQTDEEGRESAQAARLYYREITKRLNEATRAACELGAHLEEVRALLLREPLADVRLRLPAISEETREWLREHRKDDAKRRADARR
jgi:hypothetical protein